MLPVLSLILPGFYSPIYLLGLCLSKWVPSTSVGDTQNIPGCLVFVIDTELETV